MVEPMIIQVIRTHADIVSVTSEYVTLKKSGNTIKGCCPFHKEKSASFTVSQSGWFKCFGCGIGGDVFSFIMKIKGLSFLESVEELALKYNIDIAYTNEYTKEKYERLKSVSKIGAEIICTLQNAYTKALWENREALTYLFERGFTEDTIKFYQMGLAPDSWDYTVSLCKDQIDVALEIGVISKKKKGSGYIDFFRNRIMMPVENRHGSIVGWSGRALPPVDKETPKYLNSKDSFLFNKGSLLLGWNNAYMSIKDRKEVIKVEGTLDVPAMYQQGYPNTVAALGTALTPDQVKMLKSTNADVILLNDGDNAGLEATNKQIDLLIANDITSYVVELPDGTDPAALLQKNVTHGGIN